MQPSGSNQPTTVASLAPSGQPSRSDNPTGIPTIAESQVPTKYVKEHDVCTDALIVSPNGVHQMVNLNGAKPDFTANGGACNGITIGDTPGVWFAVEGTGQELKVSTCHSETQVKVKITLFSTLDNTCNTLRCEGVSLSPDFECPMTTLSSQTDADRSWSSPSTKVAFQSKAGTKYYLLVQQNTVLETGNVRLSIKPVAAPQNDDCVGALGPMPRDGTMVSTSNVDASISSVIAGYCALQPSRYPGVWYQFMGNGGSVELNACASNNLNGFSFSVYDGIDCDGLSCNDIVQTTISNDADCFFRTSTLGEEPVTGVQRDKFQAVVSTTDGSRYYVYLHYAQTEQDTVTTDDLRFSVQAVGNGNSQYGVETISFVDSKYGMGEYVPGSKNRKSFFEDSEFRNNFGG